MVEYKVVDVQQLDAELTNLANKIREKGGTTEELDFYEGDFTNAVDAIESGGTEEIESLIDESGVLNSTEETVMEKVEQLIDKAQWENFWYEASGTWTTQFTSLFNGSKTIKILPKLNFKNATVISGLCANSSLERVEYFINSSNATNLRVVFNACKSLVYIYGIDASKATNLEHAFSRNDLLETIQEPLNFSSATKVSDCFTNCTALKNIRFVPESIKISIIIPSSVLSAESIQSIIDGLALVTTAQTLTLHANAKILQSQVDSANAKGWTVAGGMVVSEEEYYA